METKSDSLSRTEVVNALIAALALIGVEATAQGPNLSINGETGWLSYRRPRAAGMTLLEPARRGSLAVINNLGETKTFPMLKTGQFNWEKIALHLKGVLETIKGLRYKDELHKASLEDHVQALRDISARLDFKTNEAGLIVLNAGANARVMATACGIEFKLTTSPEVAEQIIKFLQQVK